MVGDVPVEGLAQGGYLAFRFPDVLAQVPFPDVLESEFPGNGGGYVWAPVQSERPLFAVDEDPLRPGLVDSAVGGGVGNDAQSVAAAAVAPSTLPVDGLDERGGESGRFLVHGSAYRDPSRGRCSDRFSDRVVKSPAQEQMLGYILS